jgi:hypothetical protein
VCSNKARSRAWRPRRRPPTLQELALGRSLAQVIVLSELRCPTLQELAPGKSLAQVVAGGWRGGEAEVKQLAAQILEILQYLGSRRPPVTHRQTHPAVTQCSPLTLSNSMCDHVLMTKIT